MQLEVVGVGTRWLEFRWDTVKVHVTHYVLQMCVSFCTDWSNYTIGGSLAYTKISYLKPATTYMARVVAINDFGSSSPSPNITVTTLEDGTFDFSYYGNHIKPRNTLLISFRLYKRFVVEPSAPPNNVEAIDVDTNQVTIRWEVSNRYSFILNIITPLNDYMGEPSNVFRAIRPYTGMYGKYLSGCHKKRNA